MATEESWGAQNEKIYDRNDGNVPHPFMDMGKSK